MAIQKAKTLNNGAAGNYWRIMDININRQGFIMVGKIALFKDKATSDAGKPPLNLTKSFSFPFSMGEISAITNVVSYIYGKIVARAETMITVDIEGNPLAVPVATDPDLAGGTMV